MEIILGKNAGFCFGVKNAIKKAEENLEKYNEISCLGELVHNKQVIEKLEKKGLHTIENIEEAKNNVIIRAHGIPKQTYEIAQKLKLNLIDLTCPKVLKTHEIVENYSNKGYHIIFTGIKNHPEAIGTISFADKVSCIEDVSELDLVIKQIQSLNIKNVLLLSQTTFSLKKFDEISEKLKSMLDKTYNLEIKNTICSATELRQKETLELSKQVECMIIIGGKNSSNTKKLYDIATQNCPTILISQASELNLNELKSYNKIGVIAGASTPQESIDEVINLLNKFDRIIK